MKPFRKQNTISTPELSRKQAQSLSDQRYQDLLKNASAFFTSAEQSTQERREEIIKEINEQMERYGLTVDDLMV